MVEAKSLTAEALTIEINEPEVKPEGKTAPSRDDLKESGWSASEIEAAEKRGMIPKKEEKKPKPEEEPEITGNPGGTDKAPDKVEVPGKKEEVKRSALPDFTFKSQEQEKAFLDAFGPGTEQRAMYFRMKNERTLRQQAQAKAKELEARLAALENGRVQPPAKEVDEEGNEIDPEDKPLTLKQLREMQKREAEEIQKQQSEMNDRAQRVNQATRDQEEFARAQFPDFDEKINQAKEVMQNLETLLPEKWKQTKAIKLIRDLQVAAANADQMGIDEYTAALIAYELGSLHPDQAKASETDNDGKQPADPKKANGSLTPEQMKRIEANTQRRASSAAIPGGGGKRTVSVEEVTASDLNKMTYQERQRFKEKYPDQYTKLLRG